VDLGVVIEMMAPLETFQNSLEGAVRVWTKPQSLSRFVSRVRPALIMATSLMPECQEAFSGS